MYKIFGSESQIVNVLFSTYYTPKLPNPCQDGPISSQGLGENVVCAGNKTKLFYGN